MDIDTVNKVSSNINDAIDIIKYTYYKPICFQLYPKTENRKNWKLSAIADFFINLIKLDVKHQPGYIIGNISSYIVSFYIIYLIVKLTHFIALL